MTTPFFIHSIWVFVALSSVIRGLAADNDHQVLDEEDAESRLERDCVVVGADSLDPLPDHLGEYDGGRDGQPAEQHEEGAHQVIEGDVFPAAT